MDGTDLHPFAGLDVSLLPDGLTLQFGDEVTAPDEPERRFAADLAAVVCAPGEAQTSDLLYTVYRGVAPTIIEEEIKRRGLEYVALAMRPGTVGGEWARTRGHINPPAPASSVPFPEVHEVWHGSALLYLQKEASPTVTQVVVVPLEAGDKAVVPPGWASLVCNVGETPCVLGSWRAAECIPQHDALVALGGMAHFILKDENGSYRFDTNSAYQSVAEPRLIPAQELTDFGLKDGEPMLTTFHRNPDFLRYMMRPQDYAQVWDKLYAEEA
jgi:glucose-6-phosphate isomerase